MSRKELLHLTLTLAAIGGSFLLFYFFYKAMRLMAHERERRRELKARHEHHERRRRFRQALAPHLRPVGWKRIPLAEPVSLPHIQNRMIRIRSDELPAED